MWRSDNWLMLCCYTLLLEEGNLGPHFLRKPAVPHTEHTRPKPPVSRDMICRLAQLLLHVVAA